VNGEIIPIGGGNLMSGILPIKSTTLVSRGRPIMSLSLYVCMYACPCL